MFELNLAARLQRAGFSVDVTEDADVDFTRTGVLWFGECKRPYKLETIEQDIKAACEQLGKRLSGSRLAARGLLAISVGPMTTKAAVLAGVWRRREAAMIAPIHAPISTRRRGRSWRST